MKIIKIKNVVANIFRTRFETTSLAKILRPNLWAKNDPMVILSLSTFRGKVRFDCIFSIEIPLVHGKPLFHLKPPGIYFEGFLFPSECFPILLLFFVFSTLAMAPWLLGQAPQDPSQALPGSPRAFPWPDWGQGGIWVDFGEVASSQGR